MAIGLSNVNNRKAKRAPAAGTSKAQDLRAAVPVELKSEAWSPRGLAREGRSAERERKVASGDPNTTWLDWTNCVSGSESSSRVLNAIRRVLDLETFVFEFLVYDLQIPARAKKRILGSDFNTRLLKLRS